MVVLLGEAGKRAAKPAPLPQGESCALNLADGILQGAKRKGEGSGRKNPSVITGTPRRFGGSLDIVRGACVNGTVAEKGKMNYRF